MLEKVFIISPLLAGKGGLLSFSSTGDGKIISTFSIAHSSVCIITLFLQGALIISLLIFPRRHAPGEAGKFPWQEQMKR